MRANKLMFNLFDAQILGAFEWIADAGAAMVQFDGHSTAANA
jgi:hypothetical protein